MTMDIGALLGLVLVLPIAAAVPAFLAASKGYSFGLFWIAGLFGVVPALLIVFGMPPRAVRSDLTVEEALRHSHALAVLQTRDGMLPGELAQETAQPLEQIERELSGLEDLAIATRDSAGRWFLTDRGRSVSR